MLPQRELNFTPTRAGLFSGLLLLAIGLFLSVRSFHRVPTPEQALFVEAPFLLLVGIAAAGVTLIGRGWPHREGERLHCARCGHPWSPEIDKLHSQCQECGAPWRHYGGRVEGRPVRSRWLIGAGLVLIAMALTTPVMKGLIPVMAVPGQSTARLTRMVAGASWDAARDEWQELMKRPLSASESSALAASILDRRSREGSLPVEPARWIQAEIEMGTLPEALSQRWFSEMFEASLEAPGGAVRAEPVRIAVRGRFKGPWANAANPARVFVQGLTIEGYPGVLGRDPAARPAERYSAGAPLLEESFVPDRVGKVRIRATVWFVLGPEDELDFDGEPSLDNALYSRRIVLEKEVEVVEGR